MTLAHNARSLLSRASAQFLLVATEELKRERRFCSDAVEVRPTPRSPAAADDACSLTTTPLPLPAPSPHSDRSAAPQLFELFDPEQSGTVSASTLRHILHETLTPERLSQAEVRPASLCSPRARLSLCAR